MNNEYLFVSSEIKELETLLADLSDEDVLERIGFEHRLERAKAALSQLPQDTPHAKDAATIKLTFRGKPVDGNHGIAADFAAKALSAFSDMFGVFSSNGTTLNSLGRIPNKDINQLMVTNTAVGSFGFELQLPILFSEDAVIETQKNAIAQIRKVFDVATHGTDDEIAEVVEEVHSRAIEKVGDFLDLLVQQNAWCGLQFNGEKFQYDDLSQLKASRERLKSDNIYESTITYKGTFLGFLPYGKKFEFQIEHSQNEDGLLPEIKLIKGTVSSSCANTDIINQRLGQTVETTFCIVSVGKGRPRFVVNSIKWL